MHTFGKIQHNLLDLSQILMDHTGQIYTDMNLKFQLSYAHPYLKGIRWPCFMNKSVCIRLEKFNITLTLVKFFMDHTGPPKL